MLRYAANICNGDEFFIQCVCCLLFLLLFCCCCYICCYRLSMCFLLLDKLKLSLLNCEQAGKIIKIAPHYNHSFRAIKLGPNLPGMPFKRSTNVSKRFKMFSACRCYHTQCGTVGRIITISSDRSLPGPFTAMEIPDVATHAKSINCVRNYAETARGNC